MAERRSESKSEARSSSTATADAEETLTPAEQREKDEKAREKALEEAKSELEEQLEDGNPPNPIDPHGDVGAVLGHFAEVTDGEHEGRYGVLIFVAEDGKTGILRTRDDDNERLNVNYVDLTPSLAGRR